MKLIYLASPYTHADDMVMELRAARIAQIAAKLQAENTDVAFFSPIAHGHALAVTREGANLPVTYDFWKNHCETFISKCDELWVVCIPGWGDSLGVEAETVYASRLGIKIRHLNDDGVFL